MQNRLIRPICWNVQTEKLQKNGRVASIKVVDVFDAQKVLTHATAVSIMEKSLVVLRIVPKTEEEKNAPMTVRIEKFDNKFCKTS